MQSAPSFVEELSDTASDAGAVELLDLAEMGMDRRILDRTQGDRLDEIRSTQRVTVMPGGGELVARLIHDRLLR
jgi:hypothetical protein